MLTLLSCGCFILAVTLGWRMYRPKRIPVAPAPEPAPPETVRLSGSADEWCRVLDGETLLRSCHAQPTLDEILRQSRLAPEVFQRDLRAALVAYAEFVQLAPASESHHHAHPGGLLAHTLEAVLAAMTLRNGYLLPLHAATEVIDRQRDHWTFAVFLAALLHDIGKIMADLRLHVRDTPKAPARRWLPMSGALTQSRATEYRIGFAPMAERDYAAHRKLALVLLHGIVPANALAFLGRENVVLEALTTYLGGDETPVGAAPDTAKTLARIVKQADQYSVAHNLQHGPRERFRSAIAVPLIERLMSTLRSLLAQGTALPLNRDGAAGWVFEGAIWFVAKRLADTVRAALQKEDADEGLPGPTKNDRLFDAWQDYGVLEVNPATRQAIWHVEVRGAGYQHRLATLKFPLSRLYEDPARYPAPMEGSITPLARDEGSPAVTAIETDERGQAVAAPMPNVPMTPGSSPLVHDRDLRPSAQEPGDDGLIEAVESVMAPAPDAASMVPAPPPRLVPGSEQSRKPALSNANEIPAPRPPKAGKHVAEPPAAAKADATRAPGAATAVPAKPTTTRLEPKAVAQCSLPGAAHRAKDEWLDEGDATSTRRSRKKSGATPPLIPAAGAPVSPYAVAPKLASDKEPTALSIAFMEWVQQGLATGALPYNEAKAPIHFIAQGIALVSPRIFREYAQAVGADADAVQKQVIGAGWHVKASRNSNILHFAVMKRDGMRAGKLSAVVIARPERWVSPLPPTNPCIVPFELSVDGATVVAKAG